MREQIEYMISCLPLSFEDGARTPDGTEKRRSNNILKDSSVYEINYRSRITTSDYKETSPLVNGFYTCLSRLFEMWYSDWEPSFRG